MNDFEAFYRNNLRLVYAVALAKNVSSDQADDLVQETFFRALQQFDRLQDEDGKSQRGWLVRVVSNLIVDRWRRGQSPAPAALPVPPESERHILLRLDVQKTLAGLEDVDREIVLLRYFLEWNSREIGELLEMPEGTVRYRLSQCRNYLIERLAAWKPERENV